MGKKNGIAKAFPNYRKISKGKIPCRKLKKVPSRESKAIRGRERAYLAEISKKKGEIETYSKREKQELLEAFNWREFEEEELLEKCGEVLIRRFGV